MSPACSRGVGGGVSPQVVKSCVQVISALTPHALAASRTSSSTAPYGGLSSFGVRPKTARSCSPAPHTSASLPAASSVVRSGWPTVWFSTPARPSSVSRVKYAASYEAAPGSRNSETGTRRSSRIRAASGSWFHPSSTVMKTTFSEVGTCATTGGSPTRACADPAAPRASDNDASAATSTRYLPIPHTLV